MFPPKSPHDFGQWKSGSAWFSPPAIPSKRSKQFANEREILIQLSFHQTSNELEVIHHENAKNIIADNSDGREKKYFYSS